MLRVRTACPKCNGIARYLVDTGFIELTCMNLCGYRQVVYRLNNDGMIEKHVLPKKSVRLPKTGTKLRECLERVALRTPSTLSTGILAEEMQQSTRETSAQLVVLMHKGFVEKLESRRGRIGGSDWFVTNRALEMLGSRKR